MAWGVAERRGLPAEALTGPLWNIEVCIGVDPDGAIGDGLADLLAAEGRGNIGHLGSCHWTEKVTVFVVAFWNVTGRLIMLQHSAKTRNYFCSTHHKL